MNNFLLIFCHDEIDSWKFPIHINFFLWINRLSKVLNIVMIGNILLDTLSNLSISQSTRNSWKILLKLNASYMNTIPSFMFALFSQFSFHDDKKYEWIFLFSSFISLRYFTSFSASYSLLYFLEFLMWSFFLFFSFIIIYLATKSKWK